MAEEGDRLGGGKERKGRGRGKGCGRKREIETSSWWCGKCKRGIKGRKRNGKGKKGKRERWRRVMEGALNG